MQLDQYLQQLPQSADQKALIDLPPSEKKVAWNIVWDAFLTGDFKQRWEVAKYLPKFGDCAIAPLITLLEDESADIDLRCEAAEILGNFDNTEGIFALTEILNSDAEIELITACADALAKLGKTAILPLTAALENPETRFPAVQALAYLHIPEIIPPLLQVVNDPQPGIRKTVVETLSNFRHPQVMEALIVALQDTHSMVRKEAVIGLGITGKNNRSDQRVDALIPFLSDLNLEVCAHCAIALAKIGTPKAIKALSESLQSEMTPSPLKREIIHSLSHQKTQQTLEIFATAIRKQPPMIQEEIVTVFGRWKGKKWKSAIAKILVEFYQETPEAQANSKLKQSLAVALGNLEVPLGKPVLSTLAEDENALVKLHAQVGLKKIPSRRSSSN